MLQVQAIRVGDVDRREAEIQLRMMGYKFKALEEEVCHGVISAGRGMLRGGGGLSAHNLDLIPCDKQACFYTKSTKRQIFCVGDR